MFKAVPTNFLSCKFEMKASLCRSVVFILRCRSNPNGDIFFACHTGDLERVRFLVEECDEEVNQRDRWDSTPLYYASLCGHRPVVEYLLQQGARCEPNTFDGERSLYGALNDSIRHLLRSWKVAGASAGVARNPYIAFLTHLQEREPADVRFGLQDREFRAHRCVLAARSAFMARQLAARWRHRSVIELRQRAVPTEAFQVFRNIAIDRHIARDFEKREVI